MKRLLLVGALVALILTPVTPLVNAPISNDSPRADGPPIPLFPGSSLLVADGIPIPPCYPPGCSTLLADGIPIPPCYPPGCSTLLAEGIPHTALPTMRVRLSSQPA